MSTPEGKVKARLRCAILATFPTAYPFMPVQNGMGAPALDFFWCIGGRFIAIETKAGYGDATPRQHTTMQAVERAGGLAVVVNQKDVDNGFSILLDLIREHLDAS